MSGGRGSPEDWGKEADRMLGYWERSRFFTANPFLAAGEIRKYMLDFDPRTGYPRRPENAYAAGKMSERYREKFQRGDF